MGSKHVVRELCVGGVKKSKGHVISGKPHMAQHTGRKRSNWHKVCWRKNYGSGRIEIDCAKKKAWAKNNKQADVLPSCWPCCESTAACPRTTLQYHNFVHFAQAVFVFVFLIVFVIVIVFLIVVRARRLVTDNFATSQLCAFCSGFVCISCICICISN